jgi:hypothetical protein
MTVATRHNQLVTYYFKATGLDQNVNNHALGEQKKIESYTKVGKNEYCLSAQSLS